MSAEKLRIFMIAVLSTSLLLFVIVGTKTAAAYPSCSMMFDEADEICRLRDGRLCKIITSGELAGNQFTCRIINPKANSKKNKQRRKKRNQ